MEYTNLDVWIESRKLTNLVYDSTKTYPKEEIFGLVLFHLTSQKAVEEIHRKKQYIFCLLQEVLYMNWKLSFIYHQTKII